MSTEKEHDWLLNYAAPVATMLWTAVTGFLVLLSATAYNPKTLFDILGSLTTLASPVPWSYVGTLIAVAAANLPFAFEFITKKKYVERGSGWFFFYYGFIASYFLLWTRTEIDINYYFGLIAVAFFIILGLYLWFAYVAGDSTANDENSWDIQIALMANTSLALMTGVIGLSQVVSYNKLNDFAGTVAMYVVSAAIILLVMMFVRFEYYWSAVAIGLPPIGIFIGVALRHPATTTMTTAIVLASVLFAGIVVAWFMRDIHFFEPMEQKMYDAGQGARQAMMMESAGQYGEVSCPAYQRPPSHTTRQVE